MKKHVLTICLTVISLLFASKIPAQESNEELSIRAANPLADLMSFPFQFNNDFGLGEFNRTRNVLNVQPVIPLAGGKIITRTILPFVWIPDITAESGSFSSGLSDIAFTAFYVPGGGAITWAFGPLIEFPTGGKLRGSKKWSLGPSVVALTQAGDWTLGILANNIWSVAGSSDRASVSKGGMQYFIVRQLGNGWYVNSAPLITVNWKAADGQKWIVPFGVGGGKLIFFGGLPVNVQSQVYFNVVKPDIGPDWQFRIQIQTLLPTSMFRGGKK